MDQNLYKIFEKIVERTGTFKDPEQVFEALSDNLTESGKPQMSPRAFILESLESLLGKGSSPAPQKLEKFLVFMSKDSLLKQKISDGVVYKLLAEEKWPAFRDQNWCSAHTKMAYTQVEASNFDTILKNFAEHETDLKKLGQDLVSKYPHSKNLLDLNQELLSAIAGLVGLRDKLSSAISEAEQQEALKTDLEEQMKAISYYSKMPKKDQDVLTEYLLNQGTGLAKPEELEAFVEQSLSQKSEQDLIAEFSKKHILDLGEQIHPDANEFEAYNFGVDALRKQLQNPDTKKDIVQDLALVLIDESPESIAKLYYAKAFETIPVDTQMAPAPAPEVEENA